MIFVNSLLFSFRDIDINIGFDFLYFLFYYYFFIFFLLLFYTSYTKTFFFILIISIAPFSRKITSYKKQIDVRACAYESRINRRARA